MASLSTHVLDTSLGSPAAGVAVSLRTRAGDVLGSGVTDDDGRVGSIGPEDLEPGDYELRFDTDSYFAATQAAGFFPEVIVAFIDGLSVHAMLQPEANHRVSFDVFWLSLLSLAE